MAVYTLFNGANPTNSNAQDGNAYTLGTVINITAPGVEITDVGWRFPDVLPTGTVEFYLLFYNNVTDDNAGVIEVGAFTAPVAGQWVWQALTTPKLITSPTSVIVEVFTQNRLVSTPGFFASAVVSGPLTGPADDPVTPRRNGRYHQGSPAAFARNGVGAAYLVDIRVRTVTASLDLAVPAATLTTAASSAATGDLAAAAASATFSAAASSASTGDLAATAPAATFAAAATVTGTAALDVTAPAAVFAAAGGPPPGTVVPRPRTGTIARPNTGIIARPERTYP